MVYRQSILVTGGAGNVGGALARRLTERADTFVVIVDDLSTGSIEKLPQTTAKNWRFIQADVNDYDAISAIMISHQFDYVFHYAAVVGVQRTQNNPVAVLNDINGIRNVLELSKNTGVKKVFYASSSEVYGEPVVIPQHEETTPLNSRVPYAVVKNIGEAFLRSYHKQYGLDYTIFRFFNTYGPQQSEDFVVPRFLRQALQNEPITIYGKGDQTRTFCYVDDNVDTCLAVLDGAEVPGNVLNIGSADEISVLELAKFVIGLTDSQSEIVFLPPLEEGDMMRRQPDNSAMLQILGRELVPLAKGLQSMLPS